jgi:drug/metabolite transporter (DMT)-like permease
VSGRSLGVGAAFAAAALYAAAIALQAIEARRTPREHALRLSIVTVLSRRPLWIIGATLGFLGWAVQAFALARAPLTLVEPTLAVTPLLLLVIASVVLHQPAHLRDVAALCAITIGLAVLELDAPSRTETHQSGHGLVLAVALSAAVVLAPLVSRKRQLLGTAALGAGVAYGLVALATRFADDEFHAHHPLRCAGWLAACGIVAILGVVNEMSALQQRPVTTVAPTVFGLNVLVPVLLAPALAHEPWTSAHGHPGAIVTSLLLVLIGIATVTRSKSVSALLRPNDASRSI